MKESSSSQCGNMGEGTDFDDVKYQINDQIAEVHGTYRSHERPLERPKFESSDSPDSIRATITLVYSPSLYIAELLAVLRLTNHNRPTIREVTMAL